MKTRCIVMLLATFAIYSQSALGQEKKRPDREKIQTMQTNQIVRSLALDDATAAKFTPVYQQYLKDLRGCRTVTPNSPKVKDTKGQTASNPTDAQVEKSIKDHFAQSRKILDVREKYYNEFRKILSPKQIMKIYQLEKGNAHKYQKEWKKRQDHQSGSDKRKDGAHPNSKKQK